MTQAIDYVSDLNDKYAALEFELEEKLTTIVKAEQDLHLETMISHNEGTNKPAMTILTLETARRRNYELLKSLEVSKARLRSRATFSPLETILQKAIGSYLKETALMPCSTKKTYGPTYV